MTLNQIRVSSNPLSTLKSWAFLAKLHNPAQKPRVVVLVTEKRLSSGGKSLSRRVVQGEVRKTHGKAEKTAANKGNNSDDMRSTQFSPSSTLHRVRPETMNSRV